MLIGRAEEPASIGVGTDAVFQALLRRSGLWHGDRLQTAADVLYLADVPAARSSPTSWRSCACSPGRR